MWQLSNVFVLCLRFSFLLLHRISPPKASRDFSPLGNGQTALAGKDELGHRLQWCHLSVSKESSVDVQCGWEEPASARAVCCCSGMLLCWVEAGSVCPSGRKDRVSFYTVQPQTHHNLAWARSVPGLWKRKDRCSFKCWVLNKENGREEEDKIEFIPKHLEKKKTSWENDFYLDLNKHFSYLF